ncbi:cobalamin-dependent protein [Streptomyces sp. NPDC005336]|uniref:cobalamin B12-binding domain-containing protein n=1 Tax=Streptomyces sp. NPDC005336 TaxID=3157035 RepID=UPI0033BFAF0A
MSKAVKAAGDQAPGRAERTVVVTSMASDSHTWNLVFLQLLIEELGYRVVNLGPCVPDDLLVSECRALDPAMVVVSSVNGHGYQDGIRVIRRLRAAGPLAATPVVIGGKLGVTGHEDTARIGELMAAGFDAVFDDGADPAAALSGFVRTLQAGPPALAGRAWAV